MKPYSLKRRLLLSVLAVQLCATFVLVVGATIYEGVSRFHAFDIMLRGRADSMLGAVHDAGDEEDNVLLDGNQFTAPHHDIYAVREGAGRMLGQSANWPEPTAAFASTAPFQTVWLSHRHYRVIRVEGLRVVDPGDKDGGVPRHIVILYGAPTKLIWHGLLHAVLFYALLGALLLALSAWIMLRLLNAGLEPLNALAAQAAQVSVTSWNFEPSAQAARVQELAPLVLALETALAGLQRSFEQQKHFVGDAAHELKTSVAVVKSSLQVLTLKDRTPQEYRSGLARAQQDCLRVEALVASMLTLAGLESGPAVHVHPLDMAEVARDITGYFDVNAQLAGVQIVLRADAPAIVRGNLESLRLLYSNLIDNAIQHSPAGAQVRVVVETIDSNVHLRIEDDGDGIPADVLPFVFDRFYRGDSSRSRRTGGTGLGLAIARAVVDSMQGTIQIQSAPAQGTKVLITLPLAKDEDATSAPVDATA